MRIGHGFDVHQFSNQGELTLGGIKISEAPAMLAHSDGDVLIHALCDGILGALALGDIGEHFPDTDDQWKGADSRKLLSQVCQLMRSHHYEIGNADITVIAQRPRLGHYKAAMRELLAADLGIQLEQLNIKATTTEKMGYLGRGEGIAVHALVLLLTADAS